MRTKWPTARLDSLGEVVGGKQKVLPSAPGTPRKYLRVANVFDGYVDYSEVFEMPFTEAEFAKFSLKAGDVLLNEGQSLELVGRAAMYLGPADAYAFQNSLVRFRAHEGCDPRFAAALLRYLQHTGAFMSIASRTTSIAHLGVNRLAQLGVPRPPTEVQRRIGALANRYDRLEGGVGKLLDAKRHLKRALMHRSEGPGCGQSVLIRDVAKINERTLGEDTDPNYRFGYVELSDVSEGKLELPITTIRFADAPSRARRVVKAGDILMATVRPLLLGFARLPSHSGDMVASTGFAVLEAREPANQPFVYHSLFADAVLKQIEGRLVGSSFPAISAEVIGALRISWPEASRRESLGRCLDAVDAERRQLENLLAALRLQKRAVMQKLLAGDIELPAPEAELS